MNINQLMKQANQMQKQLTKLQNEYNQRVFNFTSADGNIKGTIKGNNDIESLEVDEQYYQNHTSQEVMTAVIKTLNATQKQINDEREKEMGVIAGNVTIPKVM